MNQKEWYLKILEWAERDDRLKIGEMQAVVLAEHLEKEFSGLTQRVPDVAYWLCKSCGQRNEMNEYECIACGSPRR